MEQYEETIEYLKGLYEEVPRFKSMEELEELMGPIRFSPDPSQGKKGLVIIDPGFAHRNFTLIWFPILGMRYVNKYMIIPLYRVLSLLDRHPDPKYRDYFNPQDCGIFCPRKSNWNPENRLSTHALALGVDVNSADNGYGHRTGTIRQFPYIIELFKANGFEWGGDWNTPDDMHFQFISSKVLLPRK